MKKLVVVERCPDYHWDRLREALEKIFASLGGIGGFVAKGRVVLLKPNLLRHARPEEAVTTHPAFIRVLTLMLQEAGARVIIADSPGAGIPHNKNSLIKLYRACGLDLVAKETGAELCLDTRNRTASLPDGKAVKRIEIIEPFFRADVVINLPKFKTHVYTRLTGAVKNLFGLVPGRIKPGYHALLRNLQRFSAMLVDVAEFTRPRLTIVDGIRGMEGEGPGGGKPRQMGLIVAGQATAAVDAVLCRITGIEPESVSTVKETILRGLIAADGGDIEIAGSSLADLVQKDFASPGQIEGENSFARVPAWLEPLLPLVSRLLTSRPAVKTDACTGCWECVRVCPARAISARGKTAGINYSLCIRCFCCHEACPSKAIRSQSPLLRRFLI